MQSAGQATPLLTAVSAANGVPTGNAGAAILKRNRSQKMVISVKETAVGTKAELDLDTPSVALDTIVRAKVAGLLGNLITVAAVADGDALLTAELDCGAEGSGALDTVIEAATAGAAGNDITVELVGDSGAAEGVTIDEVGDIVTIHFEDGVSTVADVETAIGTATLIAVKTAGTGATVLASPEDDFAPASLIGGQDAEEPSLVETTSTVVIHFSPGNTVAEIEALITADSTLIEVKTAGTGATVLDAGDAFAATALASGAGVSVSAPVTVWGKLGDNWGVAVAAQTIAGVAASDASFYRHLVVSDLGVYDRLYIEVGTITGSGAQVSATATAVAE